MCFTDGKKDKLKIQKFILNNKLPLWILEITNFLKNNNINYFYINSTQEPIEINILNIPQNQWLIILNKTRQLKLIFNVIIKQRAIINNDINSMDYGDIKKFIGNGADFIIREPQKNENTNYIQYTLMRVV